MTIDDRPRAQREAPMLLTPLEELVRSSAAQTNLLLEGDPAKIATILDVVAPYLSGPVTTWSGTSLPSADGNRTVIVPSVDRLDDVQQGQLFRWIDDTAGTVRLIATSPGSLFELVERGVFLDALYYRLNVVRIEITA